MILKKKSADDKKAWTASPEDIYLINFYLKKVTTVWNYKQISSVRFSDIQIELIIYQTVHDISSIVCITCVLDSLADKD